MRKQANGYRAPPAIPDINVGPVTEQKPNDVCVPLARGDVQRGATIQIDAVHIHSILQEVLDPLRVAAAGQEEQLHGGVEVLRHRQLRRLPHGAPPARVERRLPPEGEPRRRLPPEP